MEILVLKIGGSVQEKLSAEFYQQVVSLQQSGQCQPVIVHGGGPEINHLLAKLEVPTSFVNGLRVTSKEVLQVVEMVLSGSVNKKIVSHLIGEEGNGFGLSGVDNSLLTVEPVDRSGKLGYVGKVKEVNLTLLKQLLHDRLIPVISPIGIDEDGQHYNINGDMAAAAIAKALGGKLVFVSDIPGVMEKKKNDWIVHKTLSIKEVEDLITNKVIYGGMIPKVKSALGGLSEQMKESVILNGMSPGDLASYINGEEVGTRFIYKEETSYV